MKVADISSQSRFFKIVAGQLKIDFVQARSKKPIIKLPKIFEKAKAIFFDIVLDQGEHLLEKTIFDEEIPNALGDFFSKRANFELLLSNLEDNIRKQEINLNIINFGGKFYTTETEENIWTKFSEIVKAGNLKTLLEKLNSKKIPYKLNIIISPKVINFCIDYGKISDNTHTFMSFSTAHPDWLEKILESFNSHGREGTNPFSGRFWAKSVKSEK